MFFTVLIYLRKTQNLYPKKLIIIPIILASKAANTPQDPGSKAKKLKRFKVEAKTVFIKKAPKLIVKNLAILTKGRPSF
jgi:hypothetical protein